MPLLATDPVDIALDTATNDLLIVNGDAQLISGLDGLAQEIRIAVLMVRGEWFLNLDAGVPYLERDGVTATEAILGQPYNQVKTNAIFREAILGVNGVSTLDFLASSYTPQGRILNVQWRVTAVFGGTVADSLSRGI